MTCRCRDCTSEDPPRPERSPATFFDMGYRAPHEDRDAVAGECDSEDWRDMADDDGE